MICSYDGTMTPWFSLISLISLIHVPRPRTG
jgi:hypothetical protein